VSPAEIAAQLRADAVDAREGAVEAREAGHFDDAEAAENAALLWEAAADALDNQASEIARLLAEGGVPK